MLDLSLRWVFFQVYELPQPQNLKQYWQFSTFVQLISWFSFTCQLTTVFRQLHDHPSISKAVSRVILSIAISKQPNAAPNLLHKPWQLLQEEIVLAVCRLVNSWFHMCISFTCAEYRISIAFYLFVQHHCRATRRRFFSVHHSFCAKLLGTCCWSIQ